MLIKGGAIMPYPRIRILIVNGAGESNDTLEQILAAEGYEVACVTDPHESLEIVQQRKYHIILLDIAIPGMDGIELLAALREFDPLTQVVVMTGTSSMDKIVKCLEYGASDYLLIAGNDFSEVAETVKLAENKLNRWQRIMRLNFG
jgi:CheY-like chemotaxis protein